MKKIKLGILGAGNMGKRHIINVIEGKCPEVEITAVADLDEKNLSWAKDKLGSSLSVFDNAEDFFGCSVIDSVLIAVPHYDHPMFAMRCFDNNLHVMVEKPAGVYTKQVRLMNEAAKSVDVKFGMMFNQRTDCIYRKMRELVQSGTLGQIRRTNWIVTDWYRPQAYYASGDWRATWSGEGGGVLLNQCPHNLDLWQWICGMPVMVSAHMQFGKWHDIEVEDDVTAYVEYQNGATGVFVTSTGDAPGTNRFEITLDKGKLVAENGVLTLWENEIGEPEFSRTNKNPFGCPKAEKRIVETDGESLQHVGVLNAFAAAILRDEPLIAGGEEGINGLIISNAMHLSAWLSKPIKLPFDEDLFYNELTKRKNADKKV
ncbi:MAG: oxidoreductase [Firmicutes bacterium HGW-Firmicutes-21]|nr:MAG: oxidoreductase [Firmicutes bacterium HGW-Firmicutes-21]